MCNLFPFRPVLISVIAFGLVYCNAVTLITDLICALFGPYAATIVNWIYPGKSLKTSFVSPGKPWNLVFASPGKQYFTVCTNSNNVFRFLLNDCVCRCWWCDSILFVVAIDLIVQHIQDLLKNGRNPSTTEGIHRSVSIHSGEPTVSRPHWPFTSDTSWPNLFTSLHNYFSPR